jgi:hypothetical protein
MCNVDFIRPGLFFGGFEFGGVAGVLLAVFGRKLAELVVNETDEVFELFDGYDIGLLGKSGFVLF